MSGDAEASLSGDEKSVQHEVPSTLFVLPSLPTWASEDPEGIETGLNGGCQVSTPSQKTATTSLKEFCDKKKLNPKFDLISSAGGKFVYEAKLDHLVFTAEANSKKNARHRCSEMMLLALKDEMSDQDKIRYLKPYFSDDQIGNIQPAVAETFVDKNPIGELQEYAVALQWPTPAYELVDETGPAHVKLFVMQCSLNKLVSHGTAKSKRLAKREAALNMLAKLGKMKFADDVKSVKSLVDSTSLAQLDDYFLPETIDGDSSTVWRSEEKRSKLAKEIAAKNKLDLSVDPYLNTYKVELTPMDVDQVLSNIDSQIPHVNYCHELDKYLSMNGIKHEYKTINVLQEVHCCLIVHFDQTLTFTNKAPDCEEAKHSVARELLIHLIKQQKYKNLSFQQLNRLIPPRLFPT